MTENSTLPSWDLSDLYSGIDDPEIDADLDRSDRLAQEFKSRLSGKLATVGQVPVAEAVAEYEAINERLDRVVSYATLVFSTDRADPDLAGFFARTSERVVTIRSHLIFFELELNSVCDDLIASPVFDRYRPWLHRLRVFRPHQLSVEQERIVHEQRSAGRDAWLRLYDQTIGSLRFDIEGRQLSLAGANDLLSDSDRDRRERTARAIGATLDYHAPLIGFITSTLAKDKQLEDDWRGYPWPWSYRNTANFVEDEVVDALAASVRDAYADVAHRYYRLKASWLGVEKLAHWDLRAPLPGDDARRFEWEEAKTIVLDAFSAFSPQMAEIGARFFDNPWIDAPVRQSKYAGAFAAATVPSHHPYLLVNFQGRRSDVMILAHELGHGIHQILAKPNGHLQASAPVTLAETASVFGEMLTFRALLRRESNPVARKLLIAGKVEAMLATVIRQISFFDFERDVHLRRRRGDLTRSDISDIWMARQAESLGPAVALDDSYRSWWCPIAHFVHGPFYVYAYAFGECLVNSLYAAYERAVEEGTCAEFAERYVEMLSAGGTKRHRELLAPFCLDAADPQFWHGGLDIISRFIDQLEEYGDPSASYISA